MQLSPETQQRFVYQSVNFPETCANLYEQNARIFIELGANATCSNWISSNLKESEHLAISMNKKGKSDSQSLFEVLASLVSHGVDLDLSILYPVQSSLKTARSFNKKISPGGQRIFDYILQDKNIKQFSNLKRKPISTGQKNSLKIGTLATAEVSEKHFTC